MRKVVAALLGAGLVSQNAFLRTSKRLGKGPEWQCDSYPSVLKQSRTEARNVGIGKGEGMISLEVLKSCHFSVLWD